MIQTKRDYKAGGYSPQRKKARRNSKVGTPLIKPSLSGTTDATPANIKVAIRVRPPNERENDSTHRLVVKTLDSRMLIFDPREDEKPFFFHGVQHATHNYIKKANKEMQFMFDNVFDMNASNEDVFNESTKDLINSLMDGYNCSVFVYGATGAGKTHTMLGYAECPGITYLTMQELYRCMEDHQAERDFDICVSYLEIYNENVHDLLNPSGPLNLRDGTYGVIVSGLHSQSINTAQELFDMLEKGNRNRTQHPTDANAESSRSHAVFQVYIKMRNKTSGQVKIVKLSMIDLAGSERASATGCKGERFKEGANINRSLLALGNCINQLADGSKFIPYRDSKLTRLLKDSLGGNCRTVMIANIAPTYLSYEDTYNTLKYATRANKIQLRMRKNIVTCDSHVTQYIKRVEELTLKVRNLEAELAAARSSAKTVVVEDVQSILTSKLTGEWQSKLDAGVTPYWELLKTYLLSQSKQRCLVARALRKRRSAAMLSALRCDYSEVELREACQNQISKLQTTAESLIQQANGMTENMLEMWNRLQNLESTFKLLVDQAMKAAPTIATFVNYLECQRKKIILKAQEQHVNKISTMQYEEISHFHDFIGDSLTMLNKYYIYLKGYDRVTKLMTSEYNNLLRKAKHSQSITWEDEQDSVQCDDIHLRFMLNLDPRNIPQLPSIPKTEIESPDIESKCSSGFFNGNTTFKIGEQPDAIDSVDSEDDLNSTRTLESDVKPFLVFPDGSVSNVLSKPINPNDLNSTFVLSQKHKKGEPPVRKPNKLVGVQKRVLTERTNFLIGDNKTLKNKSTVKSEAYSKIISRSVLSKENRSGFGSSANRFHHNDLTKNSVQVGCKTVRKERNALATSGPYTRPAISQPPCK